MKLYEEIENSFPSIGKLFSGNELLDFINTPSLIWTSIILVWVCWSEKIYCTAIKIFYLIYFWKTVKKVRILCLI